jgi:hypothetical protein
MNATREYCFGRSGKVVSFYLFAVLAIGADIPVPIIGDIIRHALDEIIASCMLLIGGEVHACSD